MQKAPMLLCKLGGTGNAVSSAFFHWNEPEQEVSIHNWDIVRVAKVVAQHNAYYKRQK